MIEPYLADCRALVLDALRDIVPPDTRYTGGLYALVLDYPFRGAKALRPGICIATCRMFGGSLDAVVPTATALELYHNAFLVHDDVEDGSELRRGRATLPVEHGVPIAVNVGDAMLALAMRPLLQNTEQIGVRKALRVLQELSDMARRSAEGQALELSWVRRRDWEVAEREYLHMVYLKTACYSFVTPVRCGLLAAGVEGAVPTLARMAALLGIAFQIQDDVLNLEETPRYGKELAGDLYEGKHTLLLVHALRSATPDEREEARRILSLRRSDRTASHVSALLELVRRYDGGGYARGVAQRHAARAGRLFADAAGSLPKTIHRDFMEHLVRFVLERSW